MSKIIFWFLTIDESVKKKFQKIHPTLVSYSYVFQFINKTLKDKRGWSRFGYNFIAIDPESGFGLRKNKYKEFKVVHVRLSLNSVVSQICDFDGLSCADMSSDNIYFNAENWIYGTKASGMSRENLKIYVILHEFAHILGKGHKKCTNNENDKCSIMYQQTISKGCCKPNNWVLDSDYYDKY